MQHEGRRRILRDLDFPATILSVKNKVYGHETLRNLRFEYKLTASSSNSSWNWSHDRVDEKLK